MRILVVFGTRPEIIKLAPVCRVLAEWDGVELQTFWTGQHLELAAGLTDLFGIEVTYSGADVVDRPGLASKLGTMVQQIETVLQRDRFDWVIVQGDTTSAMAAATAAFLNRVPVAHVEAGLRTGDLSSPFPEEFNRRVVALAAKLHFAPTRAAALNLAREDVPQAAIHVVGNTVVDALLHVRDLVRSDYVPIDPKLRALSLDKKIVLTTLHRRENFGEPLAQVLTALAELARDGDKQIILPVHLNPAVRAEVGRMLAGAPNVHLLEPLQYPDFVYLLDRAWVVVTDSGGVQEEAPTFHLPVVITRESTERPEVVEAGFGRLIGCDRDAIVRSVREFTHGEQRHRIAGENPFGDGRTAERIAECLFAGRRAERRIRSGTSPVTHSATARLRPAENSMQ